MPLPDDERLDLRESLMRADLKLKERQSFWETPRNLVVMFAAFAAVVATVAGLAGYKAGQTSSAPTVIFQPGSIVVQQPAAPAQK